MLVQKGVHLCRPGFTRIWLFFLVWPEIFTTSSPTKRDIHRHFPGTEFSGGYTGQLLLVFFVWNVAFGLRCRDGSRSASLALWRLVSASLTPVYRYSGPVELHEVVCSIVIRACYRIRPEPPCVFLHRPMMVVKATIVDQHPCTFFDLPWSQSVHPVKPTLVPYPHLLQFRPCTFHVL